jgi:MarR family 2-MHQ and catechol resistance regulon transcriptional repressor|tara:strand:- start:1889 stop:2338 length:450 start_codon:yes stop_codon:yes gene_type:complete
MSIDNKIKSSFNSTQQKAVINTLLTAGFLSAQQSKFMSNYDLSMAQFNILRILRGAGEAITISTVRERMIEKSPNTTRLLDKLLEKNFICRNSCKEDKRQSYVEITDSGMDILRQIDNSDFSKLIEPPNFSESDAEQLSQLLDKLRDSY